MKLQKLADKKFDGFLTPIGVAHQIDKWVVTDNYKMWNFYVTLCLSLTHGKGFKTTKHTIVLNSEGVKNTFYKI